jgi:hypothetical protein
MDENGGKWDGKRPDPITQKKEGFYDKLLARVPLTVKSLNIIIAILFVILIAALVIGILVGNGMI